MATRNKVLVFSMAALMCAVPSTVLGQDTPEEKAAEADTSDKDKATSEESSKDEKSDESESDDDDADDEADADAEKKDDEEKKSEDGSYEFKLAYGAGFEVGVFFNGLERWNAQILEETGQPTFDTDAALNLDLAVEIYPVESFRVALFGGIQGPLSGPSPYARAVYFGVEPSFATRRGPWELALGIGAGFGGLNVGVQDTGEISAGLVLMRPFVEVRRYLASWLGVYGRVGFNYWVTYDAAVEGFEDTPRFQQDDLFSSNLNEGGFYLALGMRFGDYPEPIKVVGDKDDDGIKDDIDECPEKAEDFDEFEDKDGCPELDNDADGVEDEKDSCPLEPEDKDGWKDEDGCPEEDDDRDGDGFLDKDDKCPEQAEDKDGWKDEDGCPEDDDDRDGDGILDKDDKCPDKVGVVDRQGCPYRRVEITLKKIVIREKVFFELGKATIKPESFGLLDEVAQILVENPRIKKIEIQGHTDTAGKDRDNMKLSSARAKSVLEYLKDKGVAKSRMVAKGYGESQLLAKPAEGEKETEEQAAQNRRVEFIILKQDEAKKTLREDKMNTIDKGKIQKVVPKP